MRQQVKSHHTIYRFISALYFVMMLIILVLCFFFGPIKYARKLDHMPANLILLPIGLLFVFLVAVLIRLIIRENMQHRRWIPVILFVALFVVQCIFTYSYYFLSGWDAEVIRNASLSFANGNATALNEYYSYLSIYPNNRMIIFLFGIIARIAMAAGIGQNSYFSLIAAQCFLNSLTGFFLYSIADRLFHSIRVAVLSSVIFIFLQGLSPWVSIPYSDSLTLVFPVSVLCCWLEMRPFLKNPVVKWGLIGFLSMLGYSIKPQTVIVLIAILLVTVVTKLQNLFKERKIVLLRVSGLGIGLIAATLFIHGAYRTLPVRIEYQAAFGPSHYLMMGLCKKTNGSYRKNDVVFSMNIGTRELRKKENLRVAGKRFKDLWGYPLLRHLAKKTLTNMNDGTFTWGKEGKFYKEVYDDKTVLSKFLKNIYYRKGRYYYQWCLFAQMLWITVLFLSLFSTLGKPDENWSVILLTLIGIILFETIFEARARYFWIYVPFFILSGVRGGRILYSKLVPDNMKFVYGK